MANKVDISKSSSNSFIKTAIDFEKELKSKLDWNKKQWLQSGEAGSRSNKLCNSLNYWKDKLKGAVEDVSVVITLFNVERDEKTSLLEIINAVENLNSDIVVQGFAEFRNPRYLCLYFRTKEEKDFIMENFRIINDNYVVYLEWALVEGPKVITLKVHWLPMTMDINKIKKDLDKYVKCVEQEKNSFTFMSGRIMPSGRVTFKAALNEGIVAENVPHVMNIGDMEALITIPGRQALCLNCNKLGHISKHCELRYCVSCDSLKLKEHVCVAAADSKKSYAAIVKKVDKSEFIDQNDWGSAIVQKSEATEKKSVNIENKIMKLQNQISELDSTKNWKEPLSSSGDRGDLTVLDKKSQTLEPERAKQQDEHPHTDDNNMSDSESELEEEDDGHSVSQTLIVNEDMEIAIGDNVIVEGKKNKYRKRKRDKQMNINTEDSLLTGTKPKDNKNIQSVSYGKPNYGNLRRKKEEEKFTKLFEQREVIFED